MLKGRRITNVEQKKDFLVGLVDGDFTRKNLPFRGSWLLSNMAPAILASGGQPHAPQRDLGNTLRRSRNSL